MATSDSEDFESADEELKEETEILKGKSLCSSKPETAVKVQTAHGSSILDSRDNEIEYKIDNIAKTLEKNACLRETHKQMCLENNTGESLHKCEADNVTCQSEMHLKKEHESRVECDNIKMLNFVVGSGDNMSVSKEDKGNAKVAADALACEEETDGWDCENETDGWDCEDETDGWDCEEETDGWGEDDNVNEQQIEENCSRDRLDSVLNKLSESVDKQDKSNSSGGVDGGGSWGSWGVTSLFSTATESVSTLTNQVSQGFSSVLEMGLGVPNPEELVKQEIEQGKIFAAAKGKSALNAKVIEEENEEIEAEIQEEIEEEEEEENEEEESVLAFGIGSVISGVSKVVSGGLDTLETIGKKTMEVLQEGDPGLRKARAFFSEEAVLSELLREGKEIAETAERMLQDREDARRVHFETLFDDYHGLVHLEALEMLSRQCNIKLKSVVLNTPSSELLELRNSLTEIKDVFNLPNEERGEEPSFEIVKSRLAKVGTGLPVPVANVKLVRTWEEVHQCLQDCSNKQRETADIESPAPTPTACEIHQKSIAILARLTAECVEQFHKKAELLLVCENRNPVDEANILLYMTSVFLQQVDTVAREFSDILNTCPEHESNTEKVDSYVLNIFLEVAKCNAYIEEAFRLLTPVLQMGIVSS